MKRHLFTTDEVPGRRIGKALGLVRGSSVHARHVGKDIGAFFKNIVGGELDEYTKLLAEAREQALDRLADETREVSAVVALRFCDVTEPGSSPHT